MALRYKPEDLLIFAADLFAAAGMPRERCWVVAEMLLEADLMGHDTHGLNLAAQYLEHLESGVMRAKGDPEVINDLGATLLWDGAYLSGVWLTWAAIKEACERVPRYGTVTVSIRRSHHIACLAAFLPLATEKRYVIKLLSSDPSVAAVAPYGSYEAKFTPNPLAVGIPTAGDPVLIDISASATTMGLTARHSADGRKLDGEWLIDNQGHPSDDPAVLETDPPGALAPLGGSDRGHKGFGLALMIEALTSGLGGYGRADRAENWGAGVYLEVIDPNAFGGADEFIRQTTWLADTCRAAAVPEGAPAVRMPGDGAFSRKRAALDAGVALYPSIMPALSPWAENFGVEPPEPVDREKEL
jgi:LDH2 family malate/lactate/ureidoglycolate dehydrogenase